MVTQGRCLVPGGGGRSGPPEILHPGFETKSLRFSSGEGHFRPPREGASILGEAPGLVPPKSTARF
jgi:hypothetical protein